MRQHERVRRSTSNAAEVSELSPSECLAADRDGPKNDDGGHYIVRSIFLFGSLPQFGSVSYECSQVFWGLFSGGSGLRLLWELESCAFDAVPQSLDEAMRM